MGKGVIHTHPLAVGSGIAAEITSAVALTTQIWLLPLAMT